MEDFLEKCKRIVRKRFFSQKAISAYSAEAKILALVFGAAVGLWVYVALPSLDRFAKSARIALFPNAERAYAYGNDYFDVTNVSSYDIEAAKFFFAKAHDIDAALPYVQHQRARIAFLEGDFDLALILINDEIEQGTNEAVAVSSYYVRALIYAFMGDYEEAGRDYRRFLDVYPTNWAAANDYAWVLLRDKRARDAVDVTLRGLSHHPGNPWLLNTSAIALYEIGMHDAAREQMEKAADAMQYVTVSDWLHAYPGNDPAIADQGLAAFRDSIVHNREKMDIDSSETRYNGDE